MKVIVISSATGRIGRFDAGDARIVFSAAAAFVLLCALLVLLGYRLGSWQVTGEIPDELAVWAPKPDTAAADAQPERDQARTELDTLALRVGRMQAQLARLDALGSRLTKLAGLDEGEFDFEHEPPLGGPEHPTVSAPVDLQGMAVSLDSVALYLDDRRQQLSVLESLLLKRDLAQRVRPAGRPVAGGWLSSPYGPRADPFTGRRQFHAGVDFAGHLGADVMAVAAGVVTWAGPRHGYGNLVEIHHGDGYVTRYAHNRENLVQMGETVRKGQVIARMGSSGRSTGPHLHFEVLRDGAIVNPSRYLAAAQ